MSVKNGVLLILNNLTLTNQISTRKTVLPAYQDNLWEISKYEAFELNKLARKDILIEFMIRNEEIKNNKLFALKIAGI